MNPAPYIDDWDFNWQLRYTYKDPVPLPGRTVIEAECVYDNSAGNPRILTPAAARTALPGSS